MLKLPELIKDLAADGCTDVDAIEIATDLMKIEFVRRKLNNKINGNLIDDVIEYTKNANELDTKTFYKLGGLSDRQRQCYFLYTIKLMPMSQIAKDLGISKSSVQIHIDRAKEKLSA